MDPQLPSSREVMKTCIIGALLREVIFYYVHRLLHTKFMYRWVHHVHHEFRTPIALAASYSHPIDHVLINAMPIYLPMAIQRAHYLTLITFGAACVFDASIAHCGYSLFRMPSVHEHDVHHEKSNVNFGVWGVIDWLHGTNFKDDKDPTIEKTKLV
ncbi:hypothetical protein FQN57_006367 [Myotisia sp. PD_48]|nr:hypothetical protein FQN57_006367 [Myotisia sp. PD_48]